jgi:Zn-dependent M28 family amino/carboxypeptidase
MKRNLVLVFFTVFFSSQLVAQENKNIQQIISNIDANRIEKDIRTLANFGTRNTFSDTVSSTRGIGAARRWIKSEFEQIASKSEPKFEVFYQKDYVTTNAGERVPKDTWVVNVVAIQKSKKPSNSYVIMSGDIDSRNSDTMDFTSDAPGANDNASGMAGVIEAARVLSQFNFEHNIIYLSLSGEEQGLFGGKGFAAFVKEKNWNIIGVLNNDMIGNIEGVDGIIDNRTFRIFSEPTNPTASENEIKMQRYYGGEVDGNSRQLARYIYTTTKKHMPEMNPMMIFRLDRFGRGGHHKPFSDLGFPAVRIMETHENYNRQHQNIRTENGIKYGDVIEGVDFEYTKKLTTVNAINLASLANAPLAPVNVKIGGAVSANTTLEWQKNNDPNIIGYKIYWRETTSPTWDNSVFTTNTSSYTLNSLVIDNYYFGVAAVGKNGSESLVVFPISIIRKPFTR